MQNDFSLGKFLVLSGAVIAAAGFFLIYGKHFPFLNKLGRLPGDIKWEKEGTSFYFPITTSVLLSILMSAIAYIFRWLNKN